MSFKNSHGLKKNFRPFFQRISVLFPFISQSKSSFVILGQDICFISWRNYFNTDMGDFSSSFKMFSIMFCDSSSFNYVFRMNSFCFPWLYLLLFLYDSYFTPIGEDRSRLSFILHSWLSLSVIVSLYSVDTSYKCITIQNRVLKNKTDNSSRFNFYTLIIVVPQFS